MHWMVTQTMQTSRMRQLWMEAIDNFIFDLEYPEMLNQKYEYVM